MNSEEAKAIASAYLSKHPLEHDDYEWVVVEPRQVADGWYFDFETRCRRDVLKEQWESFAGAPGFIAKWDGTVRVVGWDELLRLTDHGAPDDGGNAMARSLETKDEAGDRFHLYPMYFVYAAVAALALAWDWRVLIGFAVLMTGAWIFARFDDKRHQAAEQRDDDEVGDHATGEMSPVEPETELCPRCNAPLFGVRIGVTTAAEIAAFAKNAVGWRDNPEAIAGWMPPGLYCANGCNALHATPIPVFDHARPAPEPERVPNPVRITLADVLRDGGSYQMHYDSDRGEAIKVMLRVITKGALRRVGYQAPRLSRLDPKTNETVDSWEIDWDEAEQLANRIHRLLAFDGGVKIGSAARAREMILYLRRRGKVR